MNILGISSDFHDSSAALVRDGKVHFSGAEERFSYQKHDSSFPSLAAGESLRAGGISAADVDWVAYHEDPVVKFSRVLTSRVQRFPRGFLSFASSMRDVMLGQLWVKFDILQKVGVSPSKIRYVPHHLSHAAYAFATSGFDSAAVLVIDAVGEWSSTTWFRAKRDAAGKLEIEPLGVVPYPHSLGMLYSAFTGFFGFRVNDGECSLMALAAFGKPTQVSKVRKLVRAQADGTYELDLSFFDFSDPARLPLSPAFYGLFGKPRSFRDPIPLSATLGPGQELTPELRNYADLAASVQAVLEESALALCAKLKRETGENDLCLAGGVALNSTMNGRIMREAGFGRVHVPPDPGDGGGALGAALYLQGRLPGGVNAGGFSPYVGRSYDVGTALGLIDGLDLGEIGSHRSIPSTMGALRGIDLEKIPEGDDRKLAQAVTKDLLAGKVVGWFQGRFEGGPRALGNRSILVDPRNSAACARLSRHVKLRAPFRPYGASLREEDFSRVFAGSAPKGLHGWKWMSSTHAVRGEAVGALSQALHVDGTTRPQVLPRAENPRYHELLGTWAEASGAPALVNTSFNESGYPMVSTPVDALLMFLRTDMDELVLNDTILRKRF